MPALAFLRAFLLWPLLFAAPWIAAMTAAAFFFPSAGAAFSALSFLGGMILGAWGSVYGLGRLR